MQFNRLQPEPLDCITSLMATTGRLHWSLSSSGSPAQPQLQRLLSTLQNTLVSLVDHLTKETLDDLIRDLSSRGSLENDACLASTQVALHKLTLFLEAHIPRTPGGNFTTATQPETAFVAYVGSNINTLVTLMANILVECSNVDVSKSPQYFMVITLASKIFAILVCSNCKLGSLLTTSTVSLLIRATLPFAMQGDCSLVHQIVTEWVFRCILFDTTQMSPWVMRHSLDFVFLKPSTVLRALFTLLTERIGQIKLGDSLQRQQKKRLAKELLFLEANLKDSLCNPILGMQFNALEALTELDVLFLKAFKLWELYLEISPRLDFENSPFDGFNAIQRLVSLACRQFGVDVVHHFKLVHREINKRGLLLENCDMFEYIGDYFTIFPPKSFEASAWKQKCFIVALDEESAELQIVAKEWEPLNSHNNTADNAAKKDNLKVAQQLGSSQNPWISIFVNNNKSKKMKKKNRQSRKYAASK